MKTLTIHERNRQQGKVGGSNSICSRFQNSSYYFREGITYSETGEYAPMFRENCGGLFQNTSNGLFPADDIHMVVGILNARLTRYLLKSFIGHTVHNEVEEVKEIHLVQEKHDNAIDILVNNIIAKQKQNPRYDYMTNEQIEINRLVYQLYNLNEEDIEEVENWFWRRYPRLAEAIENNMQRG